MCKTKFEKTKEEKVKELKKKKGDEKAYNDLLTEYDNTNTNDRSGFKKYSKKDK